jgi:hypothetical protein
MNRSDQKNLLIQKFPKNSHLLPTKNSPPPIPGRARGFDLVNPRFPPRGTVLAIRDHFHPLHNHKGSLQSDSNRKSRPTDPPQITIGNSSPIISGCSHPKNPLHYLCVLILTNNLPIGPSMVIIIITIEWLLLLLP